MLTWVKWLRWHYVNLSHEIEKIKSKVNQYVKTTRYQIWDKHTPLTLLLDSISKLGPPMTTLRSNWNPNRLHCRWAHTLIYSPSSTPQQPCPGYYYTLSFPLPETLPPNIHMLNFVDLISYLDAWDPCILLAIYMKNFCVLYRLFVTFKFLTFCPLSH